MKMGMNLALSSLPESLTLKITSRAKAMKKSGEDVIDFGVGEPDFDTPAAIKEAAIKAIREGKTKYTPASGLIELKQAIREKFQRDNQLEYEISNISVNCGAKHSLFNIFMALLNPGDEALICSPYWLSYPEQVRIAGGKPVFVSTSSINNYKATPELIDKHITSKTKVLIINSPCNPSGMVYSQEELRSLAQYLKDKDIWVVCDEVYEYLVYEGQKHYSLASFSDEMKEKCLVVNAVSKPYAMTGWRIGYCAGNEEVIKIINTLQSHSTSNPATPSQYAAIEALGDNMESVKRMVMTYAHRRQLILDMLKDIPGLQVIPPQGAFYVFPDCSELIRKKGFNDSVEICKELLEQEKVAAVPGTPFGAPECIRFSYALDDQAIIDGMQRLLHYAR